MAEAVTGKRRRFLLALLAGEDIGQAAATAEVSERTAYRWLHAAEVQEALGRVLDAQLAALAASTLGKARDAASRLHVLMLAATTPDYVAVTAAKALLDAGLRLFELRTLAERLTRVERRLVELGVNT